MELERIPWREEARPEEQSLRRRLEAEGYAVFAWTDPPGARYEPHAHERDESIWVFRGRIVFEAEGRSLALGPGDRLLLPAGTSHSALVGDEGASYLVGERS